MIVLTGASCSGKSTLLELLRKEYSEDSRVWFVDESATKVLSNTFRFFDSDSSPDSLLFTYLQLGIFHLQDSIESIILTAAKEKGVELVIMDRACLDGEAYYGKEKHQTLFNYDKDEMFGRYDRVYFLPSLAIINPGEYDRRRLNNPARYTLRDRAEKDHKELYNVWVDHPAFIDLSHIASTHNQFDILKSDFDYILNQ